MGILDDAQTSLALYNRRCVHYNLVTDGVYRARREIGDPLLPGFQPYLIAGLIGFDMRRTMGGGDLYSARKASFRSRLSSCLEDLAGDLRGLLDANLATTDLAGIRPAIENVYCGLASGDLGGEKHFDVGATKILHFLFPDLFIILDRNAANAFSRHHDVAFRRGTQPGYDAGKYLECLERARGEIIQFPAARFGSLESDTPVARIFDKIAFVVGEEV